MKWLTWTFVVGVAILASQRSQGAPLIVGNFAGTPAQPFGTGPIATYDFSSGALVNSFVPDGAATSLFGRGVQVVGNSVYYTEVGTTSSSNSTDFIRVAPFNNGLGGPDVAHLPNPDPTHGIQDLAYSGGALYALTGYSVPPSGTLLAWKLNPTTGAVLGGPIHINTPGTSNADGFTVLPNGNFLINDGDLSTTYREYNSTTGNPTGLSFVLPGGPIGTPALQSSTGVDTDGLHLYFAAINSQSVPEFVETDLSGNFLTATTFSTVGVGNQIIDISLIVPGTPEPASIALFGLGAGLFATAQMCKRNRRPN
jgi:hypothetical protein